MKQRYFSNIYWHFTGSPINVDWSRCKKPRDILNYGKPKNDKKAIDIALSILSDRFIKATCIEKISAKIQTEKFCCVTDIPLMDIELHSKYYGKVAIGFECSSIHKRFNPVLYFPNAKFPRKNEFMERVGKFVVDDFDESELKTEFQQYDIKKLTNGKFEISIREGQLPIFCTVMETGNINQCVANQIKITDFSPIIGNSFYQEREWRHIGDFYFESLDVSAIILPSDCKSEIQNFIYKTPHYKHVSVLTWEFLRSV